MGKVIDLTGQSFGCLTVIKQVGKNKHNRAIWLCKCTCGKDTVVVGSSLKNGYTRSCGCLQKEAVSKPKTEEHKRKMSTAQTGRKHTEEAKHKMSIAKKVKFFQKK